MALLRPFESLIAPLLIHFHYFETNWQDSPQKFTLFWFHRKIVMQVWNKMRASIELE